MFLDLGCYALEFLESFWKSRCPIQHIRPVKSESLGVGLGHQNLLKFSRWLHCAANISHGDRHLKVPVRFCPGKCNYPEMAIKGMPSELYATLLYQPLWKVLRNYQNVMIWICLCLWTNDKRLSNNHQNSKVWY